MKLSPEQRNILREVIKFKKPVQTIGGLAGTGKSTLVSHLIKILPDFAVCSFTGKAASILRRKGVSASTIHSLIYRTFEDEEGHSHFQLLDKLPCKGLIVDEASMINGDLFHDLNSFGLPIIFVGDHGQLEPIGDDINLMKNPDFRLETIHRNAGEIAQFANYIRQGYNPSTFPTTGEKVVFVTKQQAEGLLLKVDQIICGFNKSRVVLNQRVRKQLKRPDWPVAGDKVICLRNNHDEGLFNGMQGKISRIWKGTNRMLFDTDEGVFDIYFDPSQFNRDKYDFSYHKEDPNPFDYANAITAHKSQGDQFPVILGIEQKSPMWDQRRWNYTVASRAESKLYWLPA